MRKPPLRWLIVALLVACGDASDPSSLLGRRSVEGTHPGSDPNADPGATADDPGGVTPASTSPGAGTAPPAGAGIPCDVAALLATKCLACHSNPPTGGAVGVLVTVNDLLATSVEDNTKNEAQLSLARMQNAASPMPPASYGNPVTAAEISALSSWINGNYQGSCTDGGAPPPPAGPLTCTSCHGDATRASIAGGDANLMSAPPRGTKGETATTTKAVGAHLAHVGRTAAMGALSNPIACNECHVVPTSTGHSNNVVDIAFGTRAKTGGVAPAWNGTTCTASYCHGNFAGGSTAAAPVWTGAAMSCTSCHGAPPATGDHLRGAHNFSCGNCHGSGYSKTAVNVATHVNGVKNVGGAGSDINSYNPATRSCSPSCHGTETW